MARIEVMIRDDNGNIISQEKGKEIDLTHANLDTNELPRCKQTGYQNQKRASCSSRWSLRYSLP